MTTYGLKIEIGKLNDVLDFCEENEVNYQIWNAEEVIFGTAEIGEIEFNSQEEADFIKDLFQL